MKSEYSYAVFLDLDNTIIDANSGEILVREAYKSGLMTLKDLFFGFILTLIYKLRLMDTQKIINLMAKLISGLKVDTIQKLSKQIFEDYLKSAIRLQMQEEIEMLEEILQLAQLLLHLLAACNIQQEQR